MKRVPIGIVTVILATAALAQPVRTRILEDLSVSQSGGGEWNAVVAFQVPVREIRHTPLDQGDEVLVFVELLAVSPQDVAPALQQESLRIPSEAQGFLRSVVFDGTRAEGPLLEIRFAAPHEFEVGTGRDLRSITLHARRPLAARPAPAPAPPAPTAPKPPPEPPATAEAPAGKPADAEPESRMERARRAIALGDYALAVSYLTNVAADPESPDAQEALELLGVAREKNGQLAHAKAEYEAYLERYPEGEGADRVRQRLRAMLTARAARPAAREPEKMRTREHPLDTDLFGSVSVTYQRAAQLPEQEPELLTRSALYSDIHLTARLTTPGYSLRGRLSGRLGHDLLQEEREDRLSSLFGTFTDRERDFETTVGRQSRSSGGVLGRFDGGHVTFGLPLGMKLHGTAGLVVDSSEDFDWSPGRHFYGVSLDLPRFREKLDTQVFVIRQMADGMTDRFAVGSEMRWVGSHGFAALFLDFDLHFEELNKAYLVANWRPRDRLQLNLLADHRTSPILLTRSALRGQATDDLAGLLDRYDEDEIREIARDRTARATNLSVGTTYRLTDRLQVASDLAATYTSGTDPSAGVMGYDGMGWELSPSLQLMASDVLWTGDLAVATFRHRHDHDAETFTGSLLTRVPVGPLRIGPTVRVDYRLAEETPDLLSVRPLVRFDLRLWSFILDAEVGFEWRRQELVQQEEDLGYQMTLSLRRNF